MTETEQRYHSNKQEFLALRWAVTEQFHEYLSPYGKNRNEFVVQTDNNSLTYIFSLANLDAARQRWVAQLASYNFALEYQKGKDNTVADFLSHLDNRLPPGKVQDYLNKIPYAGVKAVLDNAIIPLTERAKQGVRPNPDNQKAGQEVTVVRDQLGWPPPILPIGSLNSRRTQSSTKWSSIGRPLERPLKKPY